MIKTYNFLSSTVIAGILFFAFSLNSHTSYGQILTYTNDSSGALSSVATNATGTPLSRVNGATRPGTPCSSGYSVTSFPSTTTYATTLPAIETSVSANTGYTLNVTGFSVDLRRSATGPANVRYAYSTDGGTTWTDQGLDQSPNNAVCGTTTTATWSTTFTVSAPNQLIFRVYGFNASGTTGTFQILNLIINGTVTSSAGGCGTPSGLSATAITTTSTTLNWAAVTGATSYTIQYRVSGTITWSTTTSATTSVAISGLTPGTIYEYQVQAVCSSGSGSFSASSYFTTLTSTTSSSSGKMAIYFNTPVNNTVSTGVNAIYLNSKMADTLVAYLNRAQYSVDIAQYDYNQSSGFANIATAVNSCYTRGVKVRWIYDGSQPNTGLTLLNAGIHTLASPTTSAYGIMHNKFVIIDANSSNPNDGIVCTGSEDWGVTQFNSDNNNILFIQDSALAHAYRNEFNMMWGDTSTVPNATLSKFGPYKTDLGAHIFHIGGKTVELYFSPSDHTDTHIQSSINSANTDLYFGVYAFTGTTDANDIVARHTAGVYTLGIVDQYSNTSSAYPILTSGLGSLMKTYASSSLVYHNKMLIVDPSNTCSDPLVLTGSHNWTTSANTLNDENTLIIHSDTISNIYYQSFYANYTALGGTLTAIAPCVATTCGVPTGLIATSITTTSALLNWTAIPGAISYNIQYRPVGTTTWSTTTSATNSVTITGLTPATNYEFQVQTVCSSGNSIFSSSTTFTTLANTCSVPTGLSVTGITYTSATLNWIAVSGAVSYNIQYRPTGTSTWSTTASIVNSVTISGLTPGTTYDFQVQVVCSTGTSAFSGSTTFTTLVISCFVPTGLLATGITATSALLNWTAVTGAISYTIQYRVPGTTAWAYTTSTINSKTISGLTPTTTYEFQVQAMCSATDSSGYSISTLFTTLPSTTVVTSNTEDLNSLYIYPNPATKDATISYYLSSAQNVNMRIYNIVGQEIISVEHGEIQQPGTHKYNISIPAPGVYFVKVTIGSSTVTGKIVIL